METLRISMAPQTVEWLWSARDEIDLEPVYQRKGGIWSVPARQYLIDSIINGFDVPKIYLADFSYGVSELNAAGRRFAVIDGKQRLLAIYGWMQNEFPLAQTFEYYDDQELSLAGLYYRDIQDQYPSLAYKISQFALAIMSVVTSDASKINELFVRLNSSKPLTGSELRNAMLGPVPAIIRKLVSRKFFVEFLPFATRRSEDKNLAAKLLLIEHRGTPVDTKKKQLDTLVREALRQDRVDAMDSSALSLIGETESVDLEGSAKRLIKHLKSLETVFTPKDVLLRQPSQIPVYYWFIRNLPLDRLADVRPFLLDFHERRQQNRRVAHQGGTTDPEIDRYELMTRSSNDAGSIKQRHLILMRRWSTYVPHPVLV